MNCRTTVVALSLTMFLSSGLASKPIEASAQAKKPAKPGSRPVKAPQQVRKPGVNLNNAEINSYLGRLRDKLDSNWLIADGRNSVTLTARLGADGVASDIALSGATQEAQQAANEAFAKAQPLESLPGSAGNSVKLTVVFDSYADPHGDSNRNITTKFDPIVEAQSPPGDAPN